MKAFLVIVLILAAAGGGYYWFFVRPAQEAATSITFRTAKVDRGEVVEGIAASGAVQPVELIQVGTQISGTIQELFADFNSKVTKGQTIAHLDDRRLASQVAQDAAAVAKDKADVERVKATLGQSQADLLRVRAAIVQTKADVGRVQALLVQARADLARQKQLAERRLTAPADVDAAVATEGALSAQLAVAEAAVALSEAQVPVAEAVVRGNESQVAVAQATVTQAEAQLEGDRVNLGYATILSPVDGVVVSRNVDVGQTVAASLSAPTLFVIARDLTKVQVQASVPEADIGRVKVKQPAGFTVDAYPERSFPGVVSQLRLASTTVQNVVTYTVIVDASNPEGVLFPGMTANVVFEVARSPKDALRVPATALRLQPSADLVESPPAAAKPAETAKEDEPKDAAPRGPGTRGSGGSGARTRRTRGVVYVKIAENRLRAVAVKAGVTDGAFTAVEPLEAGALEEGAEVVTAILKAAEATTTNPFAPTRMPGAGGRGGGR